VYVSVCLSASISATAGPIVTKVCAQIPYGRSSVLPRQRCATLCTSGYVHDVTFDRAATAMSGVAIPGRSLVSINTLLACVADVDKRVVHESSRCDLQTTQDDHTSRSVVCDVTDQSINLTSRAVDSAPTIYDVISTSL